MSRARSSKYKSRKAHLADLKRKKRNSVLRKLKRAAKQVEPAKPGRPGLSALGWPGRAYRIDLATLPTGERFFEQVPKTHGEDTNRIPGLKSHDLARTGDHPPAQTLAEKLQQGVEYGEPQTTLASSLNMRSLRIRVVGGVWQLHDELDGLPRSVFTLIPRGFSLTPDELWGFNPVKAKLALRTELNRCGAAKANGALILILHGEWDDNTERFLLHWHGWAAGGMIEAVRGLKGLAKYKSTNAARIGDTDGVHIRVRVSRKPITNPAYRLSYLLQSFWPGRRTGELAEERRGKRWYRVRAKHRIPEPHHSQYLLWLDQWRLEDISLLVKVGVVRGKLQLSSVR